MSTERTMAAIQCNQMLYCKPLIALSCHWQLSDEGVLIFMMKNMYIKIKNYMYIYAVISSVFM